MKYTPYRNFIYSLCPLPRTAALKTLNSVICRQDSLPSAVSKGNELYRIETDSLSVENSPHWQNNGHVLKTILNLTAPSLLACGLHKLMMHFGLDREGFSVRTRSGVRERATDFSLINYLRSNDVLKNDNLGLASLPNPAPDLYLSFPSTKH